MKRSMKASKRGFSLLETMLSVAILLVVTLMVYEGFMSTLNYAGDTALAERVGNENAGACYADLGSKTNGNTTTHKANEDAGAAIMITGTNFKSVLQVEAFDELGGMSVFSSGSNLTDASTFVNTTNRHGFAYCARSCPKHPSKPVKYFKATVGGKDVIVARCMESGCSYATGGADQNKLIVSWPADT